MHTANLFLIAPVCLWLLGTASVECQSYDCNPAETSTRGTYCDTSNAINGWFWGTKTLVGTWCREAGNYGNGCDCSSWDNGRGGCSCGSVHANERYYCYHEKACTASCPSGYSLISGCGHGSDIVCAAGNTGSASTDCQPGQYIKIYRTIQDCGYCAAGTYNDAMNQVACKPCPPNYYCQYGGMITPVPCPSGLTSFGGATACSAMHCSAGTYRLGDQCIACASGYYSTTQDAVSCTACRSPIPGYYVREACTATSNTQLDFCSNSIPGGSTYMLVSNDSKDPTIAGNSNCPWGCDVGNYFITPYCARCPWGTTTTVVGATSYNQCLACDIPACGTAAGTGYYLKQPDQGQCVFEKTACSNAVSGVNYYITQDGCSYQQHMYYYTQCYTAPCPTPPKGYYSKCSPMQNEGVSPCTNAAAYSYYYYNSSLPLQTTNTCPNALCPPCPAGMYTAGAVSGYTGGCANTVKVSDVAFTDRLAYGYNIGDSVMNYFVYCSASCPDPIANAHYYQNPSWQTAAQDPQLQSSSCSYFVCNTGFYKTSGGTCVVCPSDGCAMGSYRTTCSPDGTDLNIVRCQVCSNAKPNSPLAYIYGMNPANPGQCLWACRKGAWYDSSHNMCVACVARSDCPVGQYSDAACLTTDGMTEAPSCLICEYADLIVFTGTGLTNDKRSCPFRCLFVNAFIVGYGCQQRSSITCPSWTQYVEGNSTSDNSCVPCDMTGIFAPYKAYMQQCVAGGYSNDACLPFVTAVSDRYSFTSVGGCQYWCADGYTSQSDGSCAPCPTNTYKTVFSRCETCTSPQYTACNTVASQCLPADPNAAAAFSPSDACSASNPFPFYCNAGFYAGFYAVNNADLQTYECKSCGIAVTNALYIAPDPLNRYPCTTSLFTCNTGYYANITAFQCVACPASTFSNVILTPQDTTAISLSDIPAQLSASCRVACNSGYFMDANARACVSCPPAYYCPDYTAKVLCNSTYYCPALTVALSKCATGFYCPNTTSQLACPQGSYNNISGATSLASCIACTQWGYATQKTLAATSCTKCSVPVICSSVGTYMAQVNVSSCEFAYPKCTNASAGYYYAVVKQGSQTCGAASNATGTNNCYTAPCPNIQAPFGFFNNCTTGPYNATSITACSNAAKNSYYSALTPVGSLVCPTAVCPPCAAGIYTPRGCYGSSSLTTPAANVVSSDAVPRAYCSATCPPLISSVQNAYYSQISSGTLDPQAQAVACQQFTCNSGYYSNSTACLPCPQPVCELGYYCPICAADGSDHLTLTCLPCTNRPTGLSEFAYSYFTNGVVGDPNACEWRCRAGSYGQLDQHTGLTVSCLQCLDPALKCDTPGTYLSATCLLQDDTIWPANCLPCYIGVERAHATSSGKLINDWTSCAWECNDGFYYNPSQPSACSPWSLPTCTAWTTPHNGNSTINSYCSLCPVPVAPFPSYTAAVSACTLYASTTCLSAIAALAADSRTAYNFSQNNCSFKCNPGFELQNGLCVECPTSDTCPLGFYRPMCAANGSDSGVVACQPCTNKPGGLSALAVAYGNNGALGLSASCNWGCLVGSYFSETAYDYYLDKYNVWQRYTSSSQCIACAIPTCQKGYYPKADCLLYNFTLTAPYCDHCTYPGSLYYYWPTATIVTSGVVNDASSCAWQCNAGYFYNAAIRDCQAWSARACPSSTSLVSGTLTTDTTCAPCSYPTALYPLFADQMAACVSGGYSDSACLPLTSALSSAYLFTPNTCSFQCRPGYQLRGGICVQCPIHYYNPSDNGTCIACVSPSFTPCTVQRTYCAPGVANQAGLLYTETCASQRPPIYCKGGYMAVLSGVFISEIPDYICADCTNNPANATYLAPDSNNQCSSPNFTCALGYYQSLVLYACSSCGTLPSNAAGWRSSLLANANASDVALQRYASCGISCNTGFYVNGSYCVPCPTSDTCPLGFYRPMCAANGSDSGVVACQPCTNKPGGLSALAVAYGNNGALGLSASCNWGCLVGSYFSIQAGGYYQDKNNAWQTYISSSLCIACAIPTCQIGYYPKAGCLLYNFTSTAPACDHCTYPGSLYYSWPTATVITSGVVNDASSCAWQCNAGYFYNAADKACQAWSARTCPSSTSLVSGTPATDTTCAPCAYPAALYPLFADHMAACVSGGYSDSACLLLTSALSSAYLFTPNTCSFQCRPGYQLRGGICVQCPIHYYNPSYNGTCIPCVYPNFTPCTVQRTYCAPGVANQAGLLYTETCASQKPPIYCKGGYMAVLSGVFISEIPDYICADCTNNPANATYLAPDSNNQCSSPNFTCALGFYQSLSTYTCASCGTLPANAAAWVSKLAPTTNASDAALQRAGSCNVSCSAGYITSEKGLCTPCPVGAFAGANSSSCQLCSAGFHCEQAAARPVACQKGFYCPNGSSLIQCPAGYYCSEGSSNAAKCPANFVCEPGSYQPMLCATGYYGFQICAPCAAGTFANTTNSSTCSLCLPGTFSAQLSSTMCTGCPVGTYAAQANASSCAQCAAGTFANTTNSSSCSLCLPGTFSAKLSSTVCTGCSVGTYAAQANASSCTPCAAGTYTAQTSTITCAACSSGMYCPGGSTSQTVCKANFYCPSAADQIACDNSFYCPPGSSGQVLCALGYYAGSACSICAAGTYSAVTNASGCAQCDLGTYCAPGSTQPIACNAGYYCPSSSLKYLCSPGDICPAASLAPTRCPAGSYCPSTTSEPLLCDLGSYCALGTVNTAQCLTGYYCPNTSSQIACGAGAYCISSGLTQEVKCSPNYYCPNVTSQIQCSSAFYCPSGSFRQILCALGYRISNTTALCTVCPTGTYSGVTNASVCTACGVGTYCLTGSTQAALCPAGYYCQNSSVSIKCQSGYCAAGSTAQGVCPAGYYCPNSSAAVSCTLGNYCPAGSGSQTACPVSYYCPNTSTAVACVTGDYCVVTGLSKRNLCTAGFFCSNPSSIQACFTGRPYYCGPGAWQVAVCSKGYYCPTSSQQIACPTGYYCPAQVYAPTLCPAGSYCDSTQIISTCDRLPPVCQHFATGGDSTFTDVDGYLVHQFLQSGTLEFTQGTLADVLVIGGGGGGGNFYGSGGGGAGAVVYYPAYHFEAMSFTVQVGQGGSTNTECGVNAANGMDSFIKTTATTHFLASGGGGGGSLDCSGSDSGMDGSPGGSSGGGGSMNRNTGAISQSPAPKSNNIVATRTGLSQQTAPGNVWGNRGGQGDTPGDVDVVGGGGGGAGSTSSTDASMIYDGGDWNMYQPGTGGAGLSSPAFLNFGLAFTSKAVLSADQNYYIAGGGCGGSQQFYTGWLGIDAFPGSMGGGGADYSPAKANTGSGGGGHGGNGGSGLVLVRYAVQCSNAPKATYCPAGSMANTACRGGYYCPSNIEEVLCSAGTYCPTGSFQEAVCKSTSFCPAGSSEDVCPAGMFISVEGLCTYCELGTYTNASDMTSCITCISSDRAAFCEECSATAAYSPSATGATTCLQCPQYALASTDGLGCVCSPGMYLQTDPVMACVPCGGDALATSWGQTSCSQCGFGVSISST